MISIYGLYCPKSGELRYIGKANDARKRLSSHLKDCNRRKTPCACWIKSLVENGQVPVMKVLAEVQESEWEQAEREFISEARLRGEDLLNVARGGVDIPCSRETRSDNARRINRNRASSAEEACLWRLKQRVGLCKKWFEENGCTDSPAYQKIISAMKYAFIKNPKKFPTWG